MKVNYDRRRSHLKQLLMRYVREGLDFERLVDEYIRLQTTIIRSDEELCELSRGN